MRDLDKALAEIGAIRSQLGREVAFRGYGALTVAATGVVAIIASICQAMWIGNAEGASQAYLGLWIGTAALSTAMIAAETVTRSRRLHSNLADEMISEAVEQLLPSFAGGALVTIVIGRIAPEYFAMLPGLWQIFFALGVFASSRNLPRTTIWAGVWYLSCGVVVIALAHAGGALSPWAMGLPFGVGQLLTAALFHRALGGSHAED